MIADTPGRADSDYARWVKVRLTDDREVVVREIRATDKLLLEAGLRALSLESVRRRFLTAKPGLSAAELRYLTEIDGFDHHALVALRSQRPDRLAAVARFVRLSAAPTTAEAAIVVCDDLQGLGLGRALALLLADAARERGITRFSASLLSENPAALRLMHTISQRLIDGGYQAGVHEVQADLFATATRSSPQVRSSAPRSGAQASEAPLRGTAPGARSSPWEHQPARTARGRREAARCHPDASRHGARSRAQRPEEQPARALRARREAAR